MGPVQPSSKGCVLLDLAGRIETVASRGNLEFSSVRRGLWEALAKVLLDVGAGLLYCPEHC